MPVVQIPNARAVIAAVKAGCFCDVGHFYCPEELPSGGVRFPCGAIVLPDGTFKGPARLLEQLSAWPSADFTADPVHPALREPQCGDRIQWRNCADGRVVIGRPEIRMQH